MSDEKRRKKEELIERIVSEKGEEAFPKLLELLEDEDPEVKEIVSEVFYRLGDRAREFLFNEIQKRRERGFEKNDITNLYIIDILGDLGEKRMKSVLYELMEKYDSEEALLIIYEALAKIGEGEVFLPELEYLMFEDAYRKELCEQVAMVLANIPTERSLRILLKALRSDDFSEDQKEFFRRAVEMILYRKPELSKYVTDEERKELGL
jgi:HEAT repeat protein